MPSTNSSRFDVVQMLLAVSGPQPVTLDGHLTTVRGLSSQVLTVSVGSLLAYCHDPASVAAYAAAWQVAAEYAPRLLPAAGLFAPTEDRNRAALVLRLEGAPVRQQVNGIPAQATPTGLAHVRVALDRLVVHAYDVQAVRAWAEGWAQAKADADRLWPQPDAFDLAEQADQRRAARRRVPSSR